MACHRTSNSRRGFYGMGEGAKATYTDNTTGALMIGQSVASGTIQQDYQDDVHKGKIYTADNGERRSIENCNACHSKQYYKSPLANVALNANHDFPKGNSDMDVRNDLDYAPNAKSCEECHMTSKHPVVPSDPTGKRSLLSAHTELWTSQGNMAGYSQKSLTRITQRHFDVVDCQACHINSKSGRHGKPLQLLYRYRRAADGKEKIMTYNPRLRARWLDKTSGRVLVKTERLSVLKKSKDKDGKLIAIIEDPITGEKLGQVPARQSRYGFRTGDPETYEDWIALKKAYDQLLVKKGYKNPDTTYSWSESNEYVVSHNTRPAADSVQCNECHNRTQRGAYASLVSPDGILGQSNVKKVTSIPDNRLVAEGVITLELPYMKLQENGDITENVADILYATRVDPFMTLLKNSSASEITGAFKKVKTSDLLSGVGAQLGALMKPDFKHNTSFIFQVNKGKFSLRNMAAAINGSLTNDFVFPTYWGVMGIVKGASTDGSVQDMLTARHYGQLRSDVFYFDVKDKAKKPIKSLNGASMYIKVMYKGNKTDVNAINIVTADLGVKVIKTLPAENILMIQPAKTFANGGSFPNGTKMTEEGFVIFKTDQLGYFVVADK